MIKKERDESHYSNSHACSNTDLTVENIFHIYYFLTLSTINIFIYLFITMVQTGFHTKQMVFKHPTKALLHISTAIYIM